MTSNTHNFWDLVPEHDPVLHTVASPIVNFDQVLQDNLNKLKQALLRHKGIGLAAPQVGWGVRAIAVLDIANTKGGEPGVFAWSIPKSFNHLVGGGVKRVVCRSQAKE